MDLGGTKIEMGVVNSKGEILSLKKEILKLSLGKDHVLQSIVKYAREICEDFPSIEIFALSSCGPLDSQRGELLDATNLLTEGKGWGTVPILQYMEQKLGKKGFLENDASCSALAEKWLGIGKKKSCENFIVLTLGTGLGTGVVCNNVLFRGGRGRSPEAGHMIIDYDAFHSCSCGVKGDSESYLSGSNFKKRFHTIYRRYLSSKEITKEARYGEREAVLAFEEYAKMMAVTLHNYCITFSPEWIVFGGSFAEAFDVFAPKTKIYLEELLSRRKDIIPQLALSELDNHSSLLGAAALCFL